MRAGNGSHTDVRCDRNSRRYDRRVLSESTSDSIRHQFSGIRVRGTEERDKIIAGVAEQDICNAKTRANVTHNMTKEIIANGAAMIRIDLLQVGHFNE